MQNDEKCIALVFTTPEPIPEIYARARDDVYLYLSGEMGFMRSLTALELAAVIAADMQASSRFAVSGAGQLTRNLVGLGLREGTWIQRYNGSVVAWLRLLNPSAAQRAAVDAALRKYRGRWCQTADADDAGWEPTELLEEWRRRHRPIRIVQEPARRRRGAARGAAHPHYRRNPIPPLRLVQGGA